MIVITCGFVHLFKGFDRPKRLFCVAFSKATALRVAEPRGSSALAVSFWELFLCGSCPKEKVGERLIVIIDGATIFKHQTSLAAFLWRNKRKEKLTKETLNTGLRAPYPRHCAWSARFWKSAAKQSRGCGEAFWKSAAKYRWVLRRVTAHRKIRVFASFSDTRKSSRFHKLRISGSLSWLFV